MLTTTIHQEEHKQLLQLDAVSTRLGKQAFGPFTIHIQSAEKIAILGPSGAGKSTLLKLMSRELSAAEGHIRFQSRPLASWSLQELSRLRAVLPQGSDVAFALETDLVISLGRVSRTHDRELPQIVREAASMAHAGHLLKRRFDSLSGGEQARIQLARIFAQLWDQKNGLILVDEPLAALDPGLQFDLLDSLEDYATQRQHAVIAILHDINHALQAFDRLLLIKNGQLTGDLPSNADAVPALEALYDIALSCLRNAEGDLLVTPLRTSTRARKSTTDTHAGHLNISAGKTGNSHA
ncbi:ATP-binding cassette domain-containing protein [Undibacterium sp. Ji49W]|uniref:ATP-binding cassette domain-containing protein n=1 Tax=Undibacterium sp. Ji49W TaxID=3413040 RepID=UPI003BF0FA71